MEFNVRHRAGVTAVFEQFLNEDEAIAALTTD